MKKVLFAFILVGISNSCISKAPEKEIRTPSSQEGANFPPETFENGYVMLDVLKPTSYSSSQPEKVIHPQMSEASQALVKKLKLQPFRPLLNPRTVEKRKDKEEPWLGKNFDVRNVHDAEALSKILQRYVYEGWFARDFSPRKINYNSHFRENSERTWCHTPWLNVTGKGREAIHGLTKEFPIRTTSVYSVPEEIDKNDLAVTWGLAFFNRKICEGYDEFFHPNKIDKNFKDAEAGLAQGVRNRNIVFNSKDGAVSFKLLFNAMENWPQNMKGQWDGAYNWDVHVSPSKKSHIRRIMNVPHVQMDIGFKDSRVRGSDPALNSWIMLTYYYDPTYVGNEHLNDLDMPAVLKHMRPVGLQYGLDAGESHLFPGAKNNHQPEGVELPLHTTRLNGPVDNKVSSCLGCHAASGITFNLPEGKSAPGMGFLTKADYLKSLFEANGRSFDFNMQLDKAIRNFSSSKTDKIFPENQK